MRRQAAAEQLAKAFLPRLKMHMQQTCQLGSAWLKSSSADGHPEALDRARSVEGELGWALGVLSAAAGIDTLLARREKRGLSMLTRAIGLGDGSSNGQELPELGPLAGEGWEASFLLGWLCLHASEGASLQWAQSKSASHWRLEFSLASHAKADCLSMGAAHARIEAGASMGESARGILEVPSDWFVALPPMPKQA